MENDFSQEAKLSLNGTGWYSFLETLYSKLSDYEVQEDTSKFNVASLKNWGESGHMQGIEISKSNFTEFIYKVVNYFNLTDRVNVSSADHSFKQLTELNKLLNFTLKHETQVSCTESHKFIKGRYISIKNLKNETSIDTSCSKYENKDGEKTILIFASKSIFIDEDIVANGDSVAILSPKWVIIGNKTINLTGTTGSPHESLLESRGRNGRPGRPGGLGGTFFGVGEIFINGKNLTILANGGAGGSGEDGETGIDGTDGITPVKPSGIPCVKNLCSDGKKINGFSCQKNSCERKYIPSAYFGIISYYDVCFYQLKGQPGQEGKIGGDGGRAGIGGNPGNVTLFELNDTSGIFVYNEKGLDGRNGTGGVGGTNGKNGDDIIVKCISNLRTIWEIKSTLKNSDVDRGLNGTDGAVTRNMETPKPVRSNLEIAEIVLEYKRFFAESLLSINPGNVGYEDSLRFVENLDSSKSLLSKYKTIDFIKELKSLEELYSKFKEHEGFLYFYESLLNRLNEYSKNRKIVENSDEFNKIIGYLYSNTLTKISRVKREEKLETNLITNLGRYLNLLKEDILDLKNLQEVKNKAEIIFNYKQQYKENIDKNISAAKNLIDELITPEIDFITTKMDNDINLLIEEVKALKDATNEEKKDLLNKKEELEDAAKLRILFGSVKVISTLISFLGPIGATLGMISGTASTAVEAAVLNNGNNYQGPMLQHNNIFSETEVLRDRLHFLKLDKLNRLNVLLENLSEQVKIYPDDFGTLSEKISNIKTRLAKLDQNNFSLETYKNLKKELMEELKHEKNRLEYQEVLRNSKTKKKPIEVMRVLELNSILSSDVLNVYDKLKNDNIAVDEMTATIEKNYYVFLKLEEYEEMIHKAIVPLLQNVNSDFSTLQTKFATKPTVTLEVTKWQIQSILKNLDLQIQQLGDTLKIKNELLTCIQNLDSAMGILIDVYIQIQEYTKEQNLVNFMAEVNSNSVNTIYVEDPELVKALNDLELKLKSNIILQQYDRAFEAFKQFVFPFAHIFLKNLILPSHLQLQKSIDNLTYNAVSQFDHIIRKLRNYNDYISEYETFGTSDFNSENSSSQPFFVWRNEENVNRIKNLLSGHGDIFISDVTKSDNDKDAIKFNDLSIRFKAKDKAKQSEVDAILKGFKITFSYLGVSHFRYKKRIYVISTKRLEFWYSFDKNKNGEPVHKGGAYDMIKNSDYMLSPYGYWFIKLTAIENKNNVTFENIKKFQNDIDLELEGHGRYIIEEKLDLDLKVSDYYDVVENSDTIKKNVTKILESEGQRNEKRKKREISESSENILEKVGPKYKSWFSWLDFSILPGAEAALEVNKKPYKIKAISESISLNFNVDSCKNHLGYENVVTATSFINSGIKKVKNSFHSAFFDPMIDNFYGLFDYFSKNQKNYIDQSQTDFSSTSNVMDNAALKLENLLLAWVLLGKKFSFVSGHYESPAEEQSTKKHELAMRIFSILDDQNHRTIDKIEELMNDYENNSQWYQDLFRNDLEEIICKRNLRKIKELHNCTAEEVLADFILLHNL